MIKFEGSVADELKNYIKKKEYKRTAVIAVILFAVLSSIVITVSLLTDLIGLTGLALTTAFLIFMLLPQKGIEKRLPTAITIDGEAISLKSESDDVSKELSQVKRVLNKEKWYEFEFCSPHKNIYFVCQKNLLVEGTLEEFEKLFQEKMI